MDERYIGLRGGEPILTQNGRNKSTGRTLALGTGDMYRLQPVEIGRLSFVSAWLRLSKPRSLQQ